MLDFAFEDKLSGMVAGVDEAGRGPWAGPVVAGAAVFLTRKVDNYLLENLNDSKKITPKKREILYEKLLEAQAQGQVLIGIGEASAEEIDRFNILQATFLAMRRAVGALGNMPDYAIIVGNQRTRDFPCSCMTLVKGDARSYSVAAASIAAKVFRDHLMQKLALEYPYFGFEKNAGYGTKAHIEGLQRYGVVAGVHRLSYRPVREILTRAA